MWNNRKVIFPLFQRKEWFRCKTYAPCPWFSNHPNQISVFWQRIGRAIDRKFVQSVFCRTSQIPGRTSSWCKYVALFLKLLIMDVITAPNKYMLEAFKEIESINKTMTIIRICLLVVEVIYQKLNLDKSKKTEDPCARCDQWTIKY